MNIKEFKNALNANISALSNNVNKIIEKLFVQGEKQDLPAIQPDEIDFHSFCDAEHHALSNTYQDVCQLYEYFCYDMPVKEDERKVECGRIPGIEEDLNPISQYVYDIENLLITIKENLYYINDNSTNNCKEEPETKYMDLLSFKLENIIVDIANAVNVSNDILEFIDVL